MTDSMKRATDETLRRRAIQTAYNEENGITPESIVRPLDMTLAGIVAADYADLTAGEAEGMPEFRTQEEVDAYIANLESDMREAAKKFEFREGGEVEGHDQRAADKGVLVRVKILILNAHRTT